MKKYIFIILVFIFITCLAIILYRYKPQQVPVTIKRPVINHYAYKIKIDSLKLIYGEVKNNQNLSEILSAHISHQLIDRISKETGNVFDVRKLKTGQRFALISSGDSSGRLLYFVYEINLIDFVVYDFRDTLRAYLDKKEVKTQIRETSGTITTSLWNTFEENDLDLMLGMKMADVYAWTVDFYGLQKGDNFKLIYEEIIVDSISSGSGHILASVFTSAGKNFYAFYFEEQGRKGYYDEAARSLQRSFLKAPLRFSRISSRFTRSRMHPILRIARPHYGVDYSAPKGTPVVSLGDGRIYEAGWKGGYGRFIGVRHNSLYTTTYAHLSGYAKGIRPGVFVKQGELIGYVGSSGLSTGPHLDFRVYKNGSPVNPLTLESPPTEPVMTNYLKEYHMLVDKMKSRLDSIKVR